MAAAVAPVQGADPAGVKVQVIAAVEPVQWDLLHLEEGPLSVVAAAVPPVQSANLTGVKVLVIRFSTLRKAPLLVMAAIVATVQGADAKPGVVPAVTSPPGCQRGPQGSGLGYRALNSSSFLSSSFLSSTVYILFL
ncbi:unnamed protein product [Sphagnum tenellum]